MWRLLAIAVLCDLYLLIAIYYCTFGYCYLFTSTLLDAAAVPPMWDVGYFFNFKLDNLCCLNGWCVMDAIRMTVMIVSS